MKDFIGEFEELVLLTIATLSDNAYGVAIMLDIKVRHKRKTSIGSLHTTLTRLEEKGFIRSSMGEPSAERGGRRKRIFQITNRGKVALHSIKEMRDELWALSKATLSLTK